MLFCLIIYLLKIFYIQFFLHFFNYCFIEFYCYLLLFPLLYTLIPHIPYAYSLLIFPNYFLVFNILSTKIFLYKKIIFKNQQ